MHKLKIMILVSMVSFISTPSICASQSNKSLPLLAGASGVATLFFGLSAFVLSAPQRAKRVERIEKLKMFMTSLDALPDHLGVHGMVKKIINHGMCCDRVGLSQATVRELAPQIALTLAAITSGLVCFVACVRMSAQANEA
jgi:hypothetical protein